MAAHVVIIDSTARSTKIKTTPGKHVMDILEEACSKFGRDANLYGLKHKNKALDLSRTVMLSGLSPGARLELVAASRSPSVVSVALQLPHPEPDGTARLTDKFASDTTLWLILRKFESAEGKRRNFTARSAPLNQEQTSQSGRLYFETPVITLMSRELTSFTDLQKSLAQLGVQGGSILLRLDFRKTETPLEDAMIEIERYFKESASLEPAEPQVESTLTRDTSLLPETQALTTGDGGLPSPEREGQNDSLAESQSLPTDTKPTETQALGADTGNISPEVPIETVTGPSERLISVFAPPATTTPQAALQKANDSDFEPTLDHMKSHQRYLQASSKNKTLKSDAELAAEAESKAQKAAKIKEVEIRLRFPDQSQVSASFSNMDSAKTLYEHAQGLMQNPNEPVSLKFVAAKGWQTVPRDSEAKLISGLGLVGRVLVDVAWGDDASIEARQGPILKDEYRVKAQELPIKIIEGSDTRNEIEPEKSETKGKEKDSKRGGMPKWFKGIGKK